MDRLLVLRLQSVGLAAEAQLNGIALARTGKGGGDVTVPVHEYVIGGANRLDLVVAPPPAISPAGASVPPIIGDGQARAEARLLLPRVGNLASDQAARTLAQVAWAATEGEVYRPPVVETHEADIPVRFPRWRWLDAPRIDETDSLIVSAAAFLQDIAISLARGDPEHMINVAKLRFEELALAYQRVPAEDLARWRARVQLLHAQKAAYPEMPGPDALRLRPCAEGRLLECLGPDGLPILRCSRADGGQVFWPMRVAVVERRFYPLR